MDESKVERLRIVTRGYELSSTGMVSPSQFLRYLEHIRWTTILSSEKLPLRKFWAFGVVRSQILEIERAVSFGVELEISMWMSRLGRTSMDFSHEIVRSDDGVVVARSAATIVALDAERRPSPVGEGARDYLVERQVVGPERFDAAPMPGAWERAIDVRPSDQDLQQHVNHARYADFVEDTRWHCAQAGGYGDGTWAGPTRKLAIAYEQEARVGDGVVARTWRAEGRPGYLEFALVKGSGAVATRARIGLEAPGT